jgi:dTDP-4-amino-4,6-dideoxygalactose transaminase
MHMKVPFNDLYSQYLSIKADIDSAISGVIKDSSYIKGKAVTDFEIGFAKEIGVSHCIGCANGTDTLEIVLKGFGIKAGDEVIVPAATWISTSEAVTNIGAVPVFVDVNKDFYTIDSSLIEKKITKKTKAIIPVHFYGLPAEMDEIQAIAKSHDLKILEDCAQSHLATYRNKTTGTIGDAGSFSFFPGKNLGAYGDAGGITTNNNELADFCRKYANHGRIGKFDHEFEGRNSRLDTLHAAILNAKLPYLKEWTLSRQSIAKMYSELLANSNIKLPLTPAHSSHVYHLYVVQVENREKVQAALNEKEIQTGIHYPLSLPFSKAYSYLKAAPSDYPVAHSMMSRILSLPIYPEMSGAQVEYVCNTLKSIV